MRSLPAWLDAYGAGTAQHNPWEPPCDDFGMHFSGFFFGGEQGPKLASTPILVDVDGNYVILEIFRLGY